MRRDTGNSDDRVCAVCDGILHPYPGIGWTALFHVRPNGRFYVMGHKPTPKPTVSGTV